MLILAEDEKSDLSQVATSHLIRLIIIITVFPFIVNSFYDVDSTNVAETIMESQNNIDLLILIFLSIIFIILFDKFKIPAAFIQTTITTFWVFWFAH